MRTIVIGDVHGCIDELHKLYAILNIVPEDKVYSVGDLMDKGPDPLACVDFAMQNKIATVCGNHENKPIRWLKHEVTRKKTGKANPMSSVKPEEMEVYSKITDAQANWLMNLPVAIDIPNHNMILVHGGFLPGMPLEKQIKKHSGELMRLRYVDVNGFFVAISPDLKQPPDTFEWAEVYDGPKNVVHGHIPYDEPKITTRKSDGIRCVGIDTGCVFGGALTAYIIETKEFVSVKAAKKYCERYSSE